MRVSGVLLIGLALVMAVLPAVALQQTGVTAEAISVANLRPDPGLNQEPVMQIESGTAYPVIGRSEFYPWLLLGEPGSNTPIGWVFQDLVTVNGSLNNVPFSTVVVDGSSAAPTQAATATINASNGATAPTPTAELFGVAVGALPTPSPAPNATAAPTSTPISGITGTVLNEVNVRFGPGIDYPRIGVAQGGDVFEIVAYHTQVPWVQIRYDEVAGGFGWMAIDLLEIDGNIYSLPSTSQLDFNLPTLTPTPNAVQAVDGLPRLESAPLSPEFAALGDELWQKLLDAGFDPVTSQFGSLFLMDLQTGEALAFGDDIAYSGMSLTKINILAAIYGSLDGTPSGQQSRNIANMMICSENTASNQVLSYIGGDFWNGARQVTTFLRQAGLEDTFIVAPFANDPRVTPQPFNPPSSTADQSRANVDISNQITISELGWMLAGVYQCATDGSGPLMTGLDGAFTQNECEQMLYVMSQNQIGALIEVGVPESVPVAHKHGWIADTHGDAGVVLSPGGDYVLVVVLHSPTWLDFELSFPLIEDISMTVYNYYNPDQPMSATRTSNVPEQCNLFETAEGAQIIDNLSRGIVPPDGVFPR